MEIFIDIETLPGEERPNPEDIEPPKNYKDPAKIKAYQVEKVEDAYRAQALDSMRGRILTIGYAIGEDPAQAQTVGLAGIKTERDLLEAFQDMLLEAPIDAERLEWVGHNIRTFDLPWLWRKALQHRLHPLARLIPRGKFDKRIQDTLELWAADFKDRVSMDAIAQFLGINSKTEGIDGSKVFDFWQAGELQAISDYCRQDVEVSRQIFQILTGQPETVKEVEPCEF